jgi:hypothetical protein
MAISEALYWGLCVYGRIYEVMIWVWLGLSLLSVWMDVFGVGLGVEHARGLLERCIKIDSMIPIAHVTDYQSHARSYFHVEDLSDKP